MRENMRAAPRRLQLQRSKGWRMPANTVKVDRSTLFGNPFLASDYGSDRAVFLFRAWIRGRCGDVCLRQGTKGVLVRKRRAILRALPDLHGKNLACWCPLPSPGKPDTCHAAVLLELANRQSPPRRLQALPLTARTDPLLVRRKLSARGLGRDKVVDRH